nr:MAG TPA: hypothetical protein [Caudoviricetes sp.]
MFYYNKHTIKYFEIYAVAYKLKHIEKLLKTNSRVLFNNLPVLATFEKKV